MECTENRKFNMDDIPDKEPEEAWAILKKASDEKDLEDFRDVRNHRYPYSCTANKIINLGIQNLYQGSP